MRAIHATGHAPSTSPPCGRWRLLVTVASAWSLVGFMGDEGSKRRVQGVRLLFTFVLICFTGASQFRVCAVRFSLRVASFGCAFGDVRIVSAGAQPAAAGYGVSRTLHVEIL